MTSWVAIAYGALDVSRRDDFDDDVEILLLPVKPSPPIGIFGEVADLWRRLAAGPLNDSDVTDDERVLLDEFAASGVASYKEDHPARITHVPEPWLFSPMHELVNSLVGSLARDNGIALLVIKGPVLDRQGIRKKKHSGDVDFWVDPGKIQFLEKKLEAWGWVHQAGLWDGTNVNHSSTMDRGEWGCQIDLHEYFPGIDVSNVDAFDVVREGSETIEFAAVAVACPSIPAHAVISALHRMRPEIGLALSQSQVDRASMALEYGGEEAISICRRLRAMATLDQALRKAFPDRMFPDPGPLPQNWLWRTKKNRLAAYISALKMLPWYQRPKYFFRIVWPTDEAAIVSEATAGGNDSRPFQVRMNRLRRGLREVLSSLKYRGS